MDNDIPNRDEFDKQTARLSDDQMIEEGIGLCARGLFRIAKNDPRDAELSLSAVITTLTRLHVDFMRNSKTAGGLPL